MMGTYQFYTYLIMISVLIIHRKYSTKGIKRLSSAERALVTIPSEIKDILVGILLGDAHISQRSVTGNCRLHYAQTATKHKQYFYHVFSFCKPFCTEGYEPSVRTSIDKRSDQIYYAMFFVTMQLPCFNVFQELFYVLKTKIVPHNIYELLTPRGLAF